MDLLVKTLAGHPELLVMVAAIPALISVLKYKSSDTEVRLKISGGIFWGGLILPGLILIIREIAQTLQIWKG